MCSHRILAGGGPRLALWLRLACALVLALPLDAGAATGEASAAPPGEDVAPPADAFALGVTVSDPSGEPLAAAEVALDGIILGQTDASGLYYLARRPLPRGPRQLSVSHPGFVPRVQPVQLPAEGAPGVRLAVQLERAPVVAPPAARIERGAAAARLPNYRVVRLFYVTDRRNSGHVEPELRFSNERAPEGAVSMGSCEVSIPRTHQIGSLESPSWLHLEYRAEPGKHVVLVGISELAKEPFYAQLGERLRAGGKRDIVVFIHGFNNSFDEAARKLAQLTWDLQFDGVPILYSWPSQNRLFGYTQDEDTVQWTAFHLRAFLEELAARSGSARIHLIAHSMGNRALTSALEVIAAKREGIGQPLFDEVVLAAPDIGADTMNLLAREVAPVVRRMTLYASASDDALLLSRYVHGVSRAGEKGSFLLIAPGVDTVDASAARTDFIGHAYFDNSVNIITDIKQVFATGASPEARHLLSGAVRDLKYWIIPARPTGAVEVH